MMSILERAMSAASLTMCFASDVGYWYTFLAISSLWVPRSPTQQRQSNLLSNTIPSTLDVSTSITTDT